MIDKLIYRTADAVSRKRLADHPTVGKTLKNLIRGAIRRAKHWLEDDAYVDGRGESRYDNPMFLRLVDERKRNQRAHYVWGVMRGAKLAKALGISRVSVIEFGVAGGNGLVALEQIAERVEAVYGVSIDVWGFDMGTGLPKIQDYRDLPYVFSEGDYTMDVGKLRKRLTRAQLMLGPVEKTVPELLNSKPAPIAFIANDLDLYSSTLQSFKVLDASQEMLLPRIQCYFDDILGEICADFNGERLAIADFNATHEMRKISFIHGLKYRIPRRFFNSSWTDKFYMAHILDHDLYGHKDTVAAGSQTLALENDAY